MFDFLEGEVCRVLSKRITLKNNHVGFDIQVPDGTLFSLNQQIKMYTYFHWNQENGPSLFGFRTQLERDVFIMITSLSGIGPKIALSVLHSMLMDTFLNAVIESDIKTLSKINGIGTKKAENIAVLLKDKAKKFVLSHSHLSESIKSAQESSQLNATLASLGYNRNEIVASVEHAKKIVPENKRSFNLLLRASLDYFSRKA